MLLGALSRANLKATGLIRRLPEDSLPEAALSELGNVAVILLEVAWEVIVGANGLIYFAPRTII